VDLFDPVVYLFNSLVRRIVQAY